MKKIPEHCINIFVNKFNEYPSIVEIPIPPKKESVVKNIDKLISKSELVWTHIEKFNSLVEDEKIKDEIVQLLMYDKSGIMLYIQNNKTIFILTTVDRLNVTEFTVNNMLKTK